LVLFFAGLAKFKQCLKISTNAKKRQRPAEKCDIPKERKKTRGGLRGSPWSIVRQARRLAWFALVYRSPGVAAPWGRNRSRVVRWSH